MTDTGRFSVSAVYVGGPLFGRYSCLEQHRGFSGRGVHWADTLNRAAHLLGPDMGALGKFKCVI